jgi:hypothetical protein
MFKRIGMIFAVMLALLGLTAVPAQATTIHSCWDASVCLYQWTNFTGPNGPSGRYQVAFTNIWHAQGGCWNILAWWPNNTPVSGNSWSFVSNPQGGYGGDYMLRFYTEKNCVGGGAGVSLGGYTETAQLNAPYRAGTPGIRSLGLTMVV